MTQVVRPSRRRILLGAAASIAGLLVILAVGVPNLARVGWGLLVALLAVLAVAAVFVLVLVNSRIEFGDGRVKVVGFLGNAREFGVAEIGRLVTMNAVILPTMQPPGIAIRGRDGRMLYRAWGDWDSEALKALAEDLIAHGAPHVAYPHPMTVAQLEAAEPGTFRWVERNRVLVVVILLVAVLPLSLILLFVFVALVAV